MNLCAVLPQITLQYYHTIHRLNTQVFYFIEKRIVFNFNNIPILFSPKISISWTIESHADKKSVTDLQKTSVMPLNTATRAINKIHIDTIKLRPLYRWNKHYYISPTEPDFSRDYSKKYQTKSFHISF